MEGACEGLPSPHRALRGCCAPSLCRGNGGEVLPGLRVLGGGVGGWVCICPFVRQSGSGAGNALAFLFKWGVLVIKV